MSERMTVTWLDIGNRERLTVLASAVTAQTALNYLKAMSNAVVTTTSQGTYTLTDAASPAPASWAESSKVIVLSCKDSTDHWTHLFIPSPKTSLLLADLINHDGTKTEWLTLEAALSSLSVPFSGLPITTLGNATTVFRAHGAYEAYFNYNTGVNWLRRTLQWHDTFGNTYLSHMTGPPGTDPDFDTVMALIQDVSTATITAWWQGLMTVVVASPTTDLYNSVNDVAELVFADEDGTQGKIFLPAPLTDIFLADGKTVDRESTGMVLFITQAILDLIIPTSGKPVVSFIGGSLTHQDMD